MFRQHYGDLRKYPTLAHAVHEKSSQWKTTASLANRNTPVYDARPDRKDQGWGLNLRPLTIPTNYFDTTKASFVLVLQRTYISVAKWSSPQAIMVINGNDLCNDEESVPHL